MQNIYELFSVLMLMSSYFTTCFVQEADSSYLLMEILDFPCPSPPPHRIISSFSY